MEEGSKKEIVYFQCEKQLKADFYKFAQEKNLSPASLLRAFMRKAIKTWAEEKNTKGTHDENLQDLDVDKEK